MEKSYNDFSKTILKASNLLIATKFSLRAIASIIT